MGIGTPRDEGPGYTANMTFAPGSSKRSYISKKRSPLYEKKTWLKQKFTAHGSIGSQVSSHVQLNCDGTPAHQLCRACSKGVSIEVRARDLLVMGKNIRKTWSWFIVLQAVACF